MLQLFYDDFLSFVPLQLPQLLDVTTMEQPQFYDDYVLLSFPLADPYDLEEVMDIFEDDMELNFFQINFQYLFTPFSDCFFHPIRS